MPPTKAMTRSVTQPVTAPSTRTGKTTRAEAALRMAVRELTELTRQGRLREQHLMDQAVAAEKSRERLEGILASMVSDAYQAGMALREKPGPALLALPAPAVTAIEPPRGRRWLGRLLGRHRSPAAQLLTPA